MAQTEGIPQYVGQTEGIPQYWTQTKDIPQYGTQTEGIPQYGIQTESTQTESKGLARQWNLGSCLTSAFGFWSAAFLYADLFAFFCLLLFCSHCFYPFGLLFVVFERGAGRGGHYYSVLFFLFAFLIFILAEEGGGGAFLLYLLSFTVLAHSSVLFSQMFFHKLSSRF